MSRRRCCAGFAPLLALCASAGCRDALSPWTPALSSADTTGVLRLTYSTGQDEYPAWAPAGDVILYTAESAPGLPPGRGLLLALARSGGSARLVFPELQSANAPGPRWLAAPAVSPDGRRVAYIEMASVITPAVVAGPCPYAEPLLDSAVLRVRTMGATGSVLEDPAASIVFSGRDPREKAGINATYTQHAFPYQRVFRTDGVLLARPAWAPDNARLVFSDGLQVRLWTPGGGAPTVIPGSADGVSPAWSPDGQWLAFARLERGDSASATCAITRDGVARSEIRVGYSEPHHTLLVMHPDGSGAHELGEGADPAWSGDSQNLYFQRGDRIFRVAAAGGAAAEVPGTQFGRWPAIAPDGNRLAFMRSSPPDSYDVWTAPLAH